MYMGRTVETAAAREIVDRPIHPYTRALMAAMPKPDPNIRIRPANEVSEPPSQFDRPIGCPYARRCSIASAACAEAKPELREVAPGRLAACHNV
jgi:oligopeptide/dipeptide ABC transporter ATP-binding protein